MLPLPPFSPLLETAEAITTVLLTTKDLDTAMAAPRAKGAASISQGNTPFKNQLNVLDAPIHATLVPILEKHVQLDKAALLEAAFKLKLIGIQVGMSTRNKAPRPSGCRRDSIAQLTHTRIHSHG